MTEIFDNSGKEQKEMLQKQFKHLMREASLVSLSSLDVTAEDTPEQQEVIRKIKNHEFEVNNVDAFLDSLHKSKYKEFLTDYQKQQLETDFTTYKVIGYDCGFAIKNDGDIVSVHNNTGIKGGNIGKALVQTAIELGGNKLDHYAGFLDKFYEDLGFKEYERYKWDDQYASKTWDYDKFGRPDVVLRKLKEDNEDPQETPQEEPEKEPENK